MDLMVMIDVSENFKILSLLLTHRAIVKLVSMNEIGNDRIDLYESLKQIKLQSSVTRLNECRTLSASARVCPATLGGYFWLNLRNNAFE